jgi:hypothetical protein
MDQQMVEVQNEQIFRQLVPLLQQELGNDLLGVLAGGSRIYGKPGRTSDLDVHVVIASSRCCRRTVIMDGIEVEQFLHPPAQVRKNFIDDVGILPLFAQGKSLYDPCRIIVELQAEAKVLWEQGPEPIAPNEIWRHRFIPSARLRDLEDIAETDEATLALVIVEVCNQLLETHYRLHHCWKPKAKRVLNNLAQWDAPAELLARTVLSLRPLVERQAALVTLAEHVLAPLGGLMPIEWSNPWEELAG